MKRLLFILLALFTWYLAAMYHLVSLMVLAVAELFLLLCMFAVSRYFKRHLKIEFAGTSVVLEKNRKTACPVLIENTGRLPAGRFRMRFQTSYWNCPDKKSAFLYGSVAGGKKQALDFYIDPPWCGLLTVSMGTSQVYDYLSLFWGKIPAQGRLSVAILPEGPAMKLHLSDTFWNEQGQREAVRPAFGNGNGEIRQLREYSEGDPYRLIHWNQTARMDALWVKEQEAEQERTVCLYLNLCSEKRKNIWELDAFFEVLYALTSGLLNEQLPVETAWQGQNGVQVRMMVNSTVDCRAMLLRLYREGLVRSDDKNASSVPEKGLCLGTDLALSSNGKLVCRFSAENYRSELERSIVVL